MFRPRVIPVLLLKGNGLVKTVQFKSDKYIGDPVNAVRIFNDLESDEIVLLDINASKEGRVISTDLVRQICDEAYMPFAVGGGINNIKDAAAILKAGAEKIVLNTVASIKPLFIKECAMEFGNQSVTVSVDAKIGTAGKYFVMTNSGSVKSDYEFSSYLKIIEENGAGEIMINSIDKDGMMNGYDLDLLRLASSLVSLPVIACGGCGTLQHMAEAYFSGCANALAAGSMFVYHGTRKAVLINYPETTDLIKTFNPGN